MSLDRIFEGNALPSFPDKVVYILGAGFSMPAGAPNQAQVLRDIFEIQTDNTEILRRRESLRQFVEGDLNISIAQIAEVVLEDIYTPIDRCIADGTYLKSKSAASLATIREDLEYLISTAIASKIALRLSEVHGASEYVDRFAKYVVKKAAKRAELAAGAVNAGSAKKYDPLSIISLNWDILLDNAVHTALLADCSLAGDYDAFGVVDYCCYVSSVDGGDGRIRPGLWSLGCRGYNVKLLKLHGSMNWLQCPNCQRLFIQFGNKENMLARIGSTACRHCHAFGQTILLTGSLVMPTFLKDLSNFQIKLVWQNAGVELMEAKKLVFIGYSLPAADFEFRQLLSRMVHKDAKIEVVLYRDDTDASISRSLEEKKRYIHFFGKRQINFHWTGVEAYIDSLLVDEKSS
jgi:hypothetical protein